MKGNGMFKNDSDAVKNAICNYVAFNLDNRLTDEQFFKIVNFIDVRTLKKINDDAFNSNKRLKKFINLNRMDRKQVIRLVTRDITLFDRLDLKHFNFTINELEYFLGSHPHFVRRFNFDLNLVTGKEVIILLKADLNFLYEIDFNDKKFTRLDFQDMIRLFSDVDEAMQQINFNELDNFLIRTLIIRTKEKYINDLNLNKLNYLDWLEILKEHPNLLKHCDLTLFTSGDCFKLAQLVCVIPELDYLIQENYDNISPLAWEKLILYNPERFTSICNFSVFKEINWKNILRKKPYLRQFKID